MSIPFGVEPNTKNLVDLVEEVRTFTEGMNTESSEITTIRERVASSNIIVFLGFAYHKMNLEVLTPLDHDRVATIGKNVIGTARGISKSDSLLISDELKIILNTKAVDIRRDLKCNTLFQEYWRSFSLW